MPKYPENLIHFCRPVLEHYELEDEMGRMFVRSMIGQTTVPIFCVSRVLACYASVWGPEYLWTIALYWGYKIRNLLEKLEKCRY